MKKKSPEFKKIAFAAICAYCLVYITVGRIAELFGIIVDTSVDVSLVYVVLGSYVAYAAAATSDHISIARYGYKNMNGDGTE